MNEASSAKSNAHRDAGQQSFSDSLGAAKQHAEAISPTERGAKRDASSSKQNEAEKTVKRSKREQSTSSIDTSRLQQVDETNTNPMTLVLPTDFRAVVSEKQNQFDVSTSSTDSEQNVALPTSPIQASTWMNLGGGAAWNQHQLTPSMTPLSNTGAASTDATYADVDGATQAVVPAQDAAAAPLVQADAKATNNVQVNTPPAPIATAENISPIASGTDAAAAAAQASNASTQIAPVANNVQGTPSLLSVSAVSAGKASNAFKMVQSLKSSPKDPALSTNLPAGAKETDSYLSIQKEAKTGDDSTKDSPTTATSQRNDHSQTQQDFVTPVATPIQAPPVLTSHAHQQPASFNLNDASVAPQQKAQDASLSSQLQQAAASTPTANAEHLSTVVNSAKLMQSIGQSEMRVGMRTAEFGDISIRTSSSRDSISAQISLGHEDLAKTLSAHLPEMQTRLTTGEVVDVHIQSSNQDTSFTGGQRGANNGSAQNNQQDSGPTRSSGFSTYSSERSTIAAMPAALAASAAGNSSRLDIRA